MKAERLRCEYLDAPRGIDARGPRLTWIPAGAVVQTAWRVQVASDANLIRNRFPAGAGTLPA